MIDKFDEENQDKILEQWSMAAAVFGFNELAKMQQDIKLKIFCRSMRTEAMDAYLRAGGKSSLINTVGTLREITLSAVPCPIMFIESDIEALRQLVADYDAGMV